MTTKKGKQSPDIYRQIASSQIAEVKLKGSRFIGEALLAMNEEEAQIALKTIRKREYNATHHCWAYRLGQQANLFRYSDDGEPNSTAGQPILRQIDGRSLTYVIVVVTRYYGGTKLGTGGLMRAYGEAASRVLDICTIEEHVIRKQLTIRFSYADTSPAMHTIDSFDAKIEASDYGDETEITLAIRKSEVAAFKAQFTESLSGRGVILSAT